MFLKKILARFLEKLCLKYIFGVLLILTCLHIIYKTYFGKESIKERLGCPTDLFNLYYEQHLECFKQQNVKSIQLFTDQFDDFWPKNAIKWQKIFQKCPEKRCSVFRYKPKITKALEKSDGVYVHGLNLVRLPNRKKYQRNPRQLWMFFSTESQRNSFCLTQYKLTDLDDWFNLTLTTKSGFAYFGFDLKNLHRYQAYIDAYKKAKISSITIPIKQQKKKLAVWFVSHCHTSSKREVLVKELQKYIPIDIFGKCQFNNSKPDPCKNSPNQEQCFKELFSQYKFYLSFENTLCDSYITEKFFKLYQTHLIFNLDIVPVVLGAFLDDYLKQAPSTRSFIFASGFPNALYLADYLLYLDRNDTAYQEFFEWKRDLEQKIETKVSDNQLEKSEEFLQPVRRDPFCELCEKLHDEAFLSDTNKPSIKITQVYNPVKDCVRDEPYHSEQDMIRRLKYGCFFADRSLFSWHTFLSGFYFKVFDM